jgi:hypothetical protein
MAVFSPDTFDPLKRYISVRIGQGVPLVHADLNELDDIRNFEVRAFLKWFVGDGVPEGSDAFNITALAAPAASDFTIEAGAAAAPVGLDNISAGLGFVGRCLVDGLDAIITTNLRFTDQDLFVNKAGSAQLAVDWSVPVVPVLPNVNGSVLLYLDVWDRLVTPDEEGTLIFPGLGTESAARRRREWVVRWTNAPTVPAFPGADFIAGHSYYGLARLIRRAADPVVVTADITDLRERRLLVPPASLIEDMLGTTPTRYRQGLDRPAVSLREAVNALMRGELPSSQDAPIAPHASNDDMSFAFDFDGPDLSAYWHSDRAGAVDQVFAVRWPQGNPAAAATTPPQQLTVGAVPHRLPQSVQLPGGDTLVVYETNVRDIHYKRGPHPAAIAAAAEVAVATNPAVFERHPFVVRNGNQLVFFWHSATGPRWVYRRRQYAADFNEATGAWLDAAGVELSPLPPVAASTSAGEFYAVSLANRVYATFRTATDDIAVVALDPAAAAIQNWAGLLFTTAAQDQQPVLVTNGGNSVWVVWRAGDTGIFQERLDVPADTWAGAGTLVPGTDAPGNADSRPTVVADSTGALWLFWVSNRSGTLDIWVIRRNPVTGGFGEPRQVVAAAGTDDIPFARVDPAGVIWLFWRSQRTGNFDLYFKRLITVV